MWIDKILCAHFAPMIIACKIHGKLALRSKYTLQPVTGFQSQPFTSPSCPQRSQISQSYSASFDLLLLSFRRRNTRAYELTQKSLFPLVVPGNTPELPDIYSQGDTSVSPCIDLSWQIQVGQVFLSISVSAITTVTSSVLRNLLADESWQKIREVRLTGLAR